jgi:hypothetical protein
MSDHRVSMERESAYEPAARSLIRSVNTRMKHVPMTGQTWVRMRPPTEEELVDELINPRLVRFHRIGNEVKVATSLPDFVELRCGRETLMVGVIEFLDSWIKVVLDSDWDR